MQSEELELRTADGRRLRARISGPEGGPVVLFHTGTPGTRHLYEGHLKQGVDRGHCHLCISRPGYEESDRQLGRTFADCASDVALVLDYLGIDSVYVIGHSGGGGHALACAALLPDRVRSVAVLSSFAPRSAKGLAWFAGSCKWNLKEFKALEEGDTQLWKFLEDAIAGMRKIENGAQLRAGDMEDAYCQADRDALFGPHLEYEVQSYAKVVRSGPVGWFDDDKAIWGDWGFDLAQIDVPVAIWQGQDDRIVPAAHAEWLVRNVPGARLHLLPGEGHISYFDRHYGAILDELLALG